jgi:hypothetical protein
MKKINRMKAQIRALNIKLKAGKVKNIYAVQTKINQLKEMIQLEMDNYTWENYLSN